MTVTAPAAWRTQFGDFVCPNAYELEFQLTETFERETYLPAPVHVGAGDLVVDVGANVGVFSAWAWRRGATVHAIEPIPSTFSCLVANVGALDGVTVTMAAIGDTAGTVEMAFLPGATVVAIDVGRAALGDAPAPLAAHLSRRLGRVAPDRAEIGPVVDALVEARLAVRHVVADRITLSSVLRQHGVRRVDLLKVDVEGAEVEVLRSVGDEHWPLVQQCVVEAEGMAHATEITEILAAHGMEASVETNGVVQRDDVLLVAGWRTGSARRAEPLTLRPPVRRGHRVLQLGTPLPRARAAAIALVNQLLPAGLPDDAAWEAASEVTRRAAVSMAGAPIGFFDAPDAMERATLWLLADGEFERLTTWLVARSGHGAATPTAF